MKDFSREMLWECRKLPTSTDSLAEIMKKSRARRDRKVCGNDGVHDDVPDVAIDDLPVKIRRLSWEVGKYHGF